MYIYKIMNLDITFFIKIKPKWIRDLKLKSQATKLVEDSKGENLGDEGHLHQFGEGHVRQNIKDTVHERS